MGQADRQSHSHKHRQPQNYLPFYWGSSPALSTNSSLFLSCFTSRGFVRIEARFLHFLSAFPLLTAWKMLSLTHFPFFLSESLFTLLCRVPVVGAQIVSEQTNTPNYHKFPSLWMLLLLFLN